MWEDDIKIKIKMEIKINIKMDPGLQFIGLIMGSKCDWLRIVCNGVLVFGY